MINLIALFVGSFGHLFLNLLLRNVLPIPYHLKSLEEKQKKSRWNTYLNNYTSLSHCMIMLIYAYIELNNREYDLTAKMTNSDIFFVSFSTGYFFFDSIYILLTSLDKPTLYHHFFILIINIYSLIYHKNGCILNYIFFIGELSNPLMILYQNFSTYKNFKFLAILFGFFFCVLFLIIRIFICTYLHYSWYQEKDIPYFFFFPFSSLIFLGYLWSFEVLNKLLKYFFSSSDVNNIKKDIETPKNVYTIISSLRKNRLFIIYFKIISFTICFAPLIIFRHNSWF